MHDLAGGIYHHLVRVHIYMPLKIVRPKARTTEKELYHAKLSNNAVAS